MKAGEVVFYGVCSEWRADIFGNNAFPAEEQPFREIVEFLALVGYRVNGAPELDVVDVLQKEFRLCVKM